MTWWASLNCHFVKLQFLLPIDLPGTWSSGGTRAHFPCLRQAVVARIFASAGEPRQSLGENLCSGKLHWRKELLFVLIHAGDDQLQLLNFCEKYGWKTSQNANYRIYSCIRWLCILILSNPLVRSSLRLVKIAIANVMGFHESARSQKLWVIFRKLWRELLMIAPRCR